MAIPRVTAESIGIRGDSVNVAVAEGALIVSPVQDETYVEGVRPTWETALDIAVAIPEEERAKVPSDTSINVKHYLYGALRRS